MMASAGSHNDTNNIQGVVVFTTDRQLGKSGISNHGFVISRIERPMNLQYFESMSKGCLNQNSLLTNVVIIK